jgi:glyoxylase-like metal-dependent hydrolase (beta-lactamase superfamily II)
MHICDNLHAFLWQSMTANNCNTYFIDSPTRILIDPGHAALFDHVRRGLGSLDRQPADIDLVICTHAHPDHMEAWQLLQGSSARFAVHEQEWRFLEHMQALVESAMGIDLQKLRPDFFLQAGALRVGDLEFEICHTPGHSPGSTSIYWPDRKALFTGDVVFEGGIGRTDLPGGDSRLLKDSLTALRGLEVEWLLPGHGGIVQGRREVEANFNRVEQLWMNYL